MRDGREPTVEPKQTDIIAVPAGGSALFDLNELPKGVPSLHRAGSIEIHATQLDDLEPLQNKNKYYEGENQAHRGDVTWDF